MNWLTKLFKKAPAPQRALTQEERLAQAWLNKLPATNRWTAYAGEYCCHGPGRDKWSWKSADSNEQERLLEEMNAVLDDKQLPLTNRINIFAWKLSEALTKPPVYIE